MMASLGWKLRAIAAILPGAILLAVSAAWAGQQNAGNDTLPGVRPQKPIASHDGVYPPEPEPDTLPGGDTPTSFHVGDMKVEIHGYISYAIGFGKPIHDNRHR
ncbi:MAG: hypothetical protein L0I29_05330 [Hyphomicrobiales bacterium]|nr:hypothetical protein [Hyphomicrobiales bacterium]